MNNLVPSVLSPLPLLSRCEKTLVQAGHVLPKMWEVTITWPVGGVVKADILHVLYPAKQCIVFQRGCSTKTLEDPGAAVLKKQIIPFRPRFRHNVSIKMAKNTPKKVYQTHNLEDSSCCRLCKSVGDPAHRYNLFSKTNSEILAFAEQIYGHSLPKLAGLPQLICRPCERRLRSFNTFRKTIVETQSTLTRFKRCSKESPSPSLSRQAKSLKAQESRREEQPQRARQRLCFTQPLQQKEVNLISHLTYTKQPRCIALP